MLKLQLQIGVQPNRDRRGWAAGRAFDAKAVQFRTAEDNKRATLCMAQLIKLAAAITMPVTNAARQQYNNTSLMMWVITAQLQLQGMPDQSVTAKC
jgi:hypothetical protein